MTLYPIAHVVNQKEVLFLAMLATDNRKNIFYLDLMLIPIMLRLAVQSYGGKPYGIGIWNTPFLRNLYSQEELKQLVLYKKKVDPTGILNSGKFFATSGRWGSFQKALFQSDIFDFGLRCQQYSAILFSVFCFLFSEKKRLTAYSRALMGRRAWCAPLTGPWHLTPDT